MRGDEAVQTLPEPYVRALHLVAGGASDEEVAAAIGVSVTSVPTLLHLGTAKLEAVLAGRWAPPVGDPDTIDLTAVDVHPPPAGTTGDAPQTA